MLTSAMQKFPRPLANVLGKAFGDASDDRRADVSSMMDGVSGSRVATTRQPYARARFMAEATLRRALEYCDRR